MAIQDRYGVTYRNYWFSEPDHTAYCLAEGPDAATVEAVHRDSHGLLADEIHGVTQG